MNILDTRWHRPDDALEALRAYAQPGASSTPTLIQEDMLIVLDYIETLEREGGF